MDWIKRNLYFLIGSLVALALLGLGGWYLYSKWQLNNEILGKLDEQYTELKRLNGQSPHPGSDQVNNINAAKAVYDKAAEQPDAAKLSAASEQVQSARAALDLAANPARSFDMTQAQAQVDQARAALDAVITGARPQQRAAAQAQVAQAQAQLDQLKAGARSQQLDAAKAQVDAAQASVDTLQLQIARMVLVAPADGRLLTRSVEPGEMASAGAPLLTMVRLDDLTLTVYVPEDRYGQVKIGQATQVTVDSFPGVSFNARVATIADKAEFTPRNVQTVEGRSTTVFAIKLTISDASGRLKPGMPADVVFERK